MKNNLKIGYETLMLVLILTSLIGLFYSDHPVFTIIHRVVYFIFLIDFSTKLILALSKLKYIKKHPFELISIIPFEDFMLLARFARFLRLFRYKTLLKRYLKRLNNIVSDISLIYVTLLLLSGTLVLSIFFPPAFIIRHILLFASPIEQYPVMAVILKTIGIFYTGLLINKIWLIIQHCYERFKKE